MIFCCKRLFRVEKRDSIRLESKKIHYLSNDKIISSASGRGYFSLSFFFENGSYVDIMMVFKEGNKAKRIRPDAELIVLSLLRWTLSLFSLLYSQKTANSQHFKQSITMKLRLILLCLCSLSAYIYLEAQIKDPKATEVWEPEPRVVTPNVGTAPPSDAIVLLDGTNLEEWTNAKGEKAGWKLEDGGMTVVKGTGDIQTKRKFGSIQLHLEWRTPAVVEGKGQGRGNSGVFLQNMYEVQVLDSYNNRTYSNGQAASIYKQTMPLVNACRPPGEWQTYDIIYMEPVFNKDGIKVRSATVTVIQNGILVQNNVEIKGTTPYIGLPKNPPHGKGPLKLQDHSNPTSYRNIWVREL